MLKDSEYKRYLFTCLFALLPFFMYLGRALFYIHYSIVLILFLLLCWRDLKNVDYKNKMSLTIISYFLLTLVLNFIPRQYGIFHNYGDNVVISLMVYSVWIFSFCNRKYFNGLKEYCISPLSVVVWSIFSLSLVIVLGWALDINIIRSIKYLDILRFNHVFYHSAQNFLSISTPLLVYYYFKNKSKVVALFLAFFALSHFVSFGRTAIITLLFSAALYLLIVYARKHTFLVGGVVCSLLLIGLLTVSYVSSGDMLAFSEIHTSNRLFGAKIYIDYVMENSPILGLGMDGADYLRSINLIPYGSPHNVFLEAFVSMGFLGLLLFVGLVVSLAVQLIGIYKSLTDIHLKAMIVSMFSGILLNTQAFMSIWAKNHIVLIAFYLMFSVALCLSSTEDDKKVSY